MKQLLFILLIITASCKAQIYPLNSPVSDLPPNAYVKDLDGELDKYIGLWKGNWDGKTLYIEMRKVKYNNGDYYKDRILGERKVINSNDVVEIDRITNFDEESPEIRGVFSSFSGKERFFFFPENMCRKHVSLYIESFTTTVSKGSSTTQMVLKFMYEPSTYNPNCEHNAYIEQHDDFPINFPRGTFTLTKQ